MLENEAKLRTQASPGFSYIYVAKDILCDT